MKITELIAQLQICLETTSDIDCWLYKKDNNKDWLENPFPTVMDITKDWKKNCRELEYYNTGDQILIL